LRQLKPGDAISSRLRKSESAPWRFANYGRGSVQAANSTEPRASASGQRGEAPIQNVDRSAAANCRRGL